MKPRTENRLLAALALLSVPAFLFALAGLRPLGLLIRATGAVAAIEYVRRTRPATRDEVGEERQRLEQERSQIQQWEQQSLETFQKSIEAAEERLEQERQFALAQLSQEREAIEKEREMERDYYESAIAQLQTAIAQSNAIKRPKGVSRIEWVANQIIDVFLEFDVLADYSDSHAVPGLDYVWLIPREKVRVRKLKELSEEIQLRLALDVPPQVTIASGAVQVLIDANAKVTKPREDSGELADVPAIASHEEYFLKSVQESNHYLICGDTGAGKSTFVNNVACLAKRELGDDVEIVIIDPKFPDSQWHIDGQEIIPQYKCFERLNIDGEEHLSAYDGIFAMAEEVLNRLTKSAERKIQGKAAQKRKPILFIVDETPALLDQAGKQRAEVIEAILTAVRVGRSTKVKVLLLGQSWKCTSYGFRTKDSLNNFSCYFLRELADKSIDDWVLGRQRKSLLKSQIVAQQESALTDPLKQYFCLYKMPGYPADLGLLPPPNFYANQVHEQSGAASVPQSGAAIGAAVVPRGAGAAIGAAVVPLEKTAQQAVPRGAALPKNLLQEIEDAKRLEAIAALREQSPNILITQMINTVWADWGVVSSNGNKTRNWKKAREELRRLTGE